MTMHVRDSGVWKTATPQIKDGGAWKPHAGYVKDGGVWKLFFDNLTYTSSVSQGSAYEDPAAGIVVTVTPSSAPPTTDLSYTVRGTVGSWDTSDYNVSSPSGNKPSGPQCYWTGTEWNITVTTVWDGGQDNFEKFVVDFYLGYDTYTNLLITSPSVTVSDCVWALYDRPTWCY